MNHQDAEELHERYADRLHSNRHEAEVHWRQCEAPACLLAQEVSRAIARLKKERDVLRRRTEDLAEFIHGLAGDEASNAPGVPHQTADGRRAEDGV